MPEPGLAAGFGGTLFYRIALNPAVSLISERASAGGSRTSPGTATAWPALSDQLLPAPPQAPRALPPG